MKKLKKILVLKKKSFYMKLPDDPFMLLSVVNMKLRDGDYASLTDFCDSEGIEEEWLVKKLSSAGFDYFNDLKQFR